LDWLASQTKNRSKWIERKCLPSHKVGRLWKFEATEGDEWVRQGKAANDAENE
jgi:hypothetical protein